MTDGTKKEDATIENVVANTEVETVSTPVTSLSIQDLAQLRNIINVASQRGVFKPEDFTVVGEAYNKLNDFITNVTPQLEQAQAQAQAQADAEKAKIDKEDKE